MTIDLISIDIQVIIQEISCNSKRTTAVKTPCTLRLHFLFRSLHFRPLHTFYRVWIWLEIKCARMWLNVPSYKVKNESWFRIPCGKYVVKLVWWAHTEILDGIFVVFFINMSRNNKRECWKLIKRHFSFYFRNSLYCHIHIG